MGSWSRDAGCGGAGAVHPAQLLGGPLVQVLPRGTQGDIRLSGCEASHGENCHFLSDRWSLAEGPISPLSFSAVCTDADYRSSRPQPPWHCLPGAASTPGCKQRMMRQRGGEVGTDGRGARAVVFHAFASSPRLLQKSIAPSLPHLPHNLA